MDSSRIFGGNPLAVIIRLILLSIVVGIVLSALGITPENFFSEIRWLIQRLYDMGFGAIEWILGYLVVGAMVVVPVWLISRMFGAAGSRNRDQSN